METVDFLHHENLPTWAGVGPATLGTEGQRQTNHATQPANCRKLNKRKNNSLVSISGPGNPKVKITNSWSVCPEFEPSTAEDPLCRGAMHVKSIEISNILPLMWYGS
ncbi:hypothetical protein TNCV_1900641 [Trichonephila clavipes]|nr:hypothetical protein TNCV_1900641 [Trichonephila clavipes]